MAMGAGDTKVLRDHEGPKPSAVPTAGAWQLYLCDALLSGAPTILKAPRTKDYSENPQSLDEHLKKRRRELGLLQWGAAERMGIEMETYGNWEKGETEPMPGEFRPVVVFP